MTCVRRALRTRIVLGALAILAAAASLVMSSCLGGTCNCPSGGGGFLRLPAAQSSPIVSVVADDGCLASVSTDPGADANSILIDVTRSAAGTCTVTAGLANGDIYSFSVQFGAMGGCCGGLTTIVGQPTPQLVSAGDAGRD